MADLNHRHGEQTAFKCVSPIFFLIVDVEALAKSAGNAGDGIYDGTTGFEFRENSDMELQRRYSSVTSGADTAHTQDNEVTSAWLSCRLTEKLTGMHQKKRSITHRCGFYILLEH
jgi:hypothetical protein